MITALINLSVILLSTDVKFKILIERRNFNMKKILVNYTPMKVLTTYLKHTSK